MLFTCHQLSPTCHHWHRLTYIAWQLLLFTCQQLPLACHRWHITCYSISAHLPFTCHLTFSQSFIALLSFSPFKCIQQILMLYPGIFTQNYFKSDNWTKYLFQGIVHCIISLFSIFYCRTYFYIKWCFGLLQYAFNKHWCLLFTFC